MILSTYEKLVITVSPNVSIGKRRHYNSIICCAVNIYFLTKSLQKTENGGSNIITIISKILKTEDNTTSAKNQ